MTRSATAPTARTPRWARADVLAGQAAGGSRRQRHTHGKRAEQGPFLIRAPPSPFFPLCRGGRRRRLLPQHLQASLACVDFGAARARHIPPPAGPRILRPPSPKITHNTQQQSHLTHACFRAFTRYTSRHNNSTQQSKKNTRCRFFFQSHTHTNLKNNKPNVLFLRVPNLERERGRARARLAAAQQQRSKQFQRCGV